jgi:hypothetical protein
MVNIAKRRSAEQGSRPTSQVWTAWLRLKSGPWAKVDQGQDSCAIWRRWLDYELEECWRPPRLVLVRGERKPRGPDNDGDIHAEGFEAEIEWPTAAEDRKS